MTDIVTSLSGLRTERMTACDPCALPRGSDRIGHGSSGGVRCHPLAQEAV